MLNKILIIILLSSPLFAGIKFENWQLDKWNSKQGNILVYDKLEHGLAAITLDQSLHFILPKRFKKYGPLITLGTGIAWEIRDGLVPYDGKHIQGFSWKDLIADAGGIIISMILRKLF